MELKILPALIEDIRVLDQIDLAIAGEEYHFLVCNLRAAITDFGPAKVKRMIWYLQYLFEEWAMLEHLEMAHRNFCTLAAEDCLRIRLNELN